MPIHATTLLVKGMLQQGIDVSSSNVLVLGATFKENCSDLRNSKVIDFCKELNSYNINLDIFDPHVPAPSALIQYSLDLLLALDYNKTYNAIVFAVVAVF